MHTRRAPAIAITAQSERNEAAVALCALAIIAASTYPALQVGWQLGGLALRLIRQAL